VANIQLGPTCAAASRNWNGDGETVGGIVVVRLRRERAPVILDVKKRLDQAMKGPAADVHRPDRL